MTGAFPASAPQQRAVPHPSKEHLVLDVMYIVATIALFALVGLVAKGAEKL
ncbi:hypothetical protein [Microbacterium sp. 10M-3C3]|uniref:hypothetical protein n=1 Tax=Microbacterium sp. 10M-3C3 TaxID=2483401 RepID=UPI0013DDE206|nr:hypothetical protein [Microbacterium sp. 10M-3C3]